MRWERTKQWRTLISILSIAIWGVKTLQRRERPLPCPLPQTRSWEAPPSGSLEDEIDLDFAESERIPDPSRI